MIEIGATKAKNKLAALLDAVALGEEVVITHRGRPVARLLPYEPAVGRTKVGRTKAVAAAECIRNMRKGVTLADLKIEELIAVGRQ